MIYLGCLFIHSGRILDKDDWDKIKTSMLLISHKTQRALQHKDGHNYNGEYAKRDYTLNAASLKLLLADPGLNDDNVKPKHFNFEAYKRTGYRSKVLLHQKSRYPSSLGRNYEWLVKHLMI